LGNNCAEGDGKSISSSSSKNGGKAGSDTPSKTPTTPATSAASTAATAPNTSADAGAAPQKKKRKVELTLREEVDAELAKGSPVEPPQPEELAKALLDLENSASSDAAVREKIAAFPPEVSDVTLIEKVTGACV
jgi:regulator of Ty1 transposition protein 103